VGVGDQHLSTFSGAIGVVIFIYLSIGLTRIWLYGFDFDLSIIYNQDVYIVYYYLVVF